jgi:hypothetical protein
MNAGYDPSPQKARTSLLPMFAVVEPMVMELLSVANFRAKPELSPFLLQFSMTLDTNQKVATLFVSHSAKSCPPLLKLRSNCEHGHESRGYSSRHCMG